jgi:hypothetical protein
MANVQHWIWPWILCFALAVVVAAVRAYILKQRLQTRWTITAPASTSSSSHRVIIHIPFNGRSLRRGLVLLGRRENALKGWLVLLGFGGGRHGGDTEKSIQYTSQYVAR